MDELIGVIVGVVAVGLMFRERLRVAAVPVAAMKYSWSRGGEHRLRVQKRLALAGAFVVGLVATQSMEFGLVGAMVIALAAFGLWLALRDRAATEMTTERSTLTRRVALKLAEGRDPHAAIRSAVPRWKAVGRLDFATRVVATSSGAEVHLVGPIGIAAIASVIVQTIDGGSQAVWSYVDWWTLDSGQTPLVQPMVDLRQSWVDGLVRQGAVLA